MVNPTLNQLLSPEVQRFISEHQNDDVRKLALKKPPYASWNYASIMDQIKVRQKAKTKSPDLYDTDRFIFPPNDLFEQASSSACAKYKANLISGVSFIDLTAGAGIDSYYISKNFKTAMLVEKDCYSAELLEHNMALLADNISIHHGDALEYIQNSPKVDFAYIDPQRRGNGRKGIFDLSCCEPDIISLLETLRGKSSSVMVKTSPILDIERAIEMLQYVSQVHVVQLRGECKEVLYHLDFANKTNPDNVIINAVEIDDDGQAQKTLRFEMIDEKNAEPKYSMPQDYIYEPSPAFMKSGGFKSIAVQLDIDKIHQHSHLYTSNYLNSNFSGKIYKFIEVKPAKAKGLGIKKADLTIRNFPSTVHDLKKKLKISDGGEHKIFATTLCDETKKLIICNKI